VKTNTTLPNEPGATGDATVVDTEVESVRTRQRVAGSPGEAVASPPVVTRETTGGYFETLPERVGAVMAVVLTALEGLLGIRFLLRAYGANPSSFVGFINDVSWAFLRPFASVFSNRSWSQGVLEISTLVAMAFYLLLFGLIGMLITALMPRLSGHTRGAA
jgi:hypothetical protein